MRILHISDLHIKRVNGNFDDVERCFEQLCRQVTEIQAARAIDFIFITGDLVDRGGKSFDTLADGFATVDKIVVEPLVKITNLPRYRVLIVPGNHDVEGFRITDNFDETHPIRSESDVNWISDEIKMGSSVGKEAIARLETYNKYADSFAPNYLDSTHMLCSPLAKHFIFTINDHQIGISCLCSSWRCDKSGETDNLVLGVRQLNEADPLMENVDCRIALMHHDPFLITDWEKRMVKGIILRKYDILFIGHTHIADDTVFDNEKGRTAYCCASGIITTNVGDMNYKNGFEVIDVDINMKNLEIRKYSHNEDESFSIDLNFGTQGVSKLRFGTRKRIYPLKDILHNSKEHRSTLITNEHLTKIKDELLHTDKQTLLIGAFSGLGKTRLVYEAAREIQKNPQSISNDEDFFYSEQSYDSEELRNEIEEFIIRRKGNNSVLILDNVDYEFFNYVASRIRFKKNIRLIGLTNKIFDIPEGIHNYVKITPGDMKKAVDEYIDTKIANREDNISSKIDIKKFSHGFPMLAVALVEKYNNGENINIHDADDLINICWNDHGKRTPQESQMLKLISLFQPFPISDEAFDAILGSKCFTSLNSLDKYDRLRLRKQIVNHYGDTILEVTEGGMTVRPYPLAMHLAKQWLKEYGDPILLKDLGTYVHTLDERIGGLIIECMCSRLQKMDDDPTAVALVEELTCETGFFGNENVVCSELGSRLILAMSTVNPLAVSNALYRVFSEKKAIEISKMLSSKSRNNLLSALRYIIFDGASFEKGIEIMGKFGLSEIESYSNNSVQTFVDAFHILLSGTELNLIDRLRIIKKFATVDSESHQLTPLAIKGALAYGHFLRTGGNRFGSGHKEDYLPTNNEVIKYWQGVQELAINLIEKGEFLDEIADIIRTNLYVWSSRGVINLMLPILEAFGKKDGLRLQLSGSEWSKFMDNVNRISKMPSEILEKVKRLYPLFINEDFVTELESKAYHFHNNVRFAAEDYWEKVKEYFEPIVQKFIDDKLYEDPETLIKLLHDKGNCVNYFAPILSMIVTDEQLGLLFDAICQQIAQDAGIYSSVFLTSIVTATKGKIPTENFIEGLYNKRCHKIYIAFMAKTETPQLSRLAILRQRYSAKEFIHEYLKMVNVYLDIEFMNGLFELLENQYDDNPNDILEFLFRNSIWFDNLNEHNIDIISKILAKTDISKLTPQDEREFWELAVHIIKKRHDVELVRNLNRKVLHRFSEFNYDSESGDFYEVVFNDYLDEIWDEFADNLFGDNYGLFWHISNAITGYSLHSGLLFNLSDNYIADALKKYPDTAPVVLAKLCPLYETTENGIKFAKWAQYIIDHYGERDDVLQSISCNMGSFSCVGSVIPLYRKQIETLLTLKEHFNENVRNWSARQVSVIEDDIKREQANEDFRRMHYEG